MNNKSKQDRVQAANLRHAQERHQRCDEELEHERRLFRPDETRIKQLKQLKLRYKDTITRLQEASRSRRQQKKGSDNVVTLEVKKPRKSEPAADYSEIPLAAKG